MTDDARARLLALVELQQRAEKWLRRYSTMPSIRGESYGLVRDLLAALLPPVGSQEVAVIQDSEVALSIQESVTMLKRAIDEADTPDGPHPFLFDTLSLHDAKRILGAWADAGVVDGPRGYVLPPVGRLLETNDEDHTRRATPGNPERPLTATAVSDPPLVGQGKAQERWAVVGTFGPVAWFPYEAPALLYSMECEGTHVVQPVAQEESQTVCGNCANLQDFELTDEIKTCPVLNIRIATQEIQTFGCSLYEPKAHHGA